MAPPTSASAILSRSAVVLCGRQIVHAPAGVGARSSADSSRRTIAVGPWGHDSRCRSSNPAAPASFVTVRRYTGRP